MSSGILEGRDVAFGDLFQKIKHKSHKLTAKERAQVVAFLSKPSSISDPESHTAIYVLCLSSEPTAQNLALIEPFLADTVDDYARAAAITGMFTIWNTFEERHSDYLRDALGRVLDKERGDSSFAAFGAGLHVMHNRARYDVSVAIDQAIDALFDAVKRQDHAEDGFAANMFISACLSLTNASARNMGQRPTYFHTLDEALEVYRDKRTYLLQPVH
jgi:hypothetical protein